MKQYVVEEESTLKNFTDNHNAQASFYFRTLLKEREIRVNGKKVGADMPLKKGDTVQYFLTPAREKRKAFDPVYEDENVCVVDKESGVNSEAVYCALREKGECYFIHRLDRNTQGLIVFAKNKGAEEALLTCFRTRGVQKIYHALAVGRVTPRHAVLEGYLKKDEARATVKISASEGEKIVTEYDVIEERGDCTLLRVTLHTGKTHQIRAHLAYIGHPVAGDEKYGDNAFNRAHNLTRQQLLSKELSLECGGALAYLNGKKFISQKNL